MSESYLHEWDSNDKCYWCDVDYHRPFRSIACKGEDRRKDVPRGNPYLRPGEHWDPYSRSWKTNLTEAEVQNLWPYAKKEAPVAEFVSPDLEEILMRAGLDAPTQPGTLTSAPSVPRNQEVLAAEVANMLVMADTLKGDNVHLPQHYARFKIEPVRFCIENNLNGFQFNIVKYILRHDAKNGLEDLKKARRYLDMFILWVEGNEDWWK